MKLTKSVVNYAHDYDVSVEAELGEIAGIEERVTPEARAWHVYMRNAYKDKRSIESMVYL